MGGGFLFDDRFDAHKDQPLDPIFGDTDDATPSVPLPGPLPGALVQRIRAMNFQLYYSVAEEASLERSQLHDLEIKGQYTNLF